LWPLLDEKEEAMTTRKVLSVVGIAVLSACSTADDSTLPDTESDKAALDQDLAVTAELGLEAALLANPKNPGARRTYYLPGMVEAMIEHWATDVDKACVFTSMLADADRDGIPSEGKIAFRCGEAGPAGATYTTELMGVARIRDPNDRLPGDGADIIFESLGRTRFVSGRPMEARTLNGHFSFRVRGSPPNFGMGLAFQEKLQWLYTATGADGVTRASWYTLGATGQYTPDRYPTEQSALQSGRLSFEGTSQYVNVDGTGSTRWFWTEPALHWNQKCKAVAPEVPGFDGGALNFAIPGGITSVEFYGCGVWESYPPESAL
jgi:hypothetical protein